MSSASGSNSFVGYLIDNPLYASNFAEIGAEAMPTSSAERESREREEQQSVVGPKENQLHVCEDSMFSQMQSLAVSTYTDQQPYKTISHAHSWHAPSLTELFSINWHRKTLSPLHFSQVSAQKNPIGTGVCL